MNEAQAGKANGRAQRVVPILLVVCVVVVGFWEIMASRSRRPFSPFQITGEDFRAFAPVSPLWSVRPLRLPASPTEPNIVAFELTTRRDGVSTEVPETPASARTPPGLAAAPILVRLVHGYNMCDCMRIKGYKVEAVEEGMAHGAERMAQKSEEASGNPTTQQPGNSAINIEGAPASMRQIWRLKSSTGQVSIWITAMIRAGDFGETDVDVRSMAFPRIGIPDDPRWAPRGFTWRSLRHPMSNSRKFLQAKWNNSRCDWATFLGLRQPAWANDELLTLVAAWSGPSVGRDDEQRVKERVLAASDFLYGELKKWRQAGTKDE